MAHPPPPRRNTCRDCEADLVWIQILDDADDLRSVAGLRFFDVASPERGVIHAARCPACGAVHFFAFPSYGEALPENVFEAEQRRRHRAAQAAAAAKAPPSIEGPRPAVYALMARFADRLTPDHKRAKALHALVGSAEVDTWLPLLLMEAGRLPADSEVVPAAVGALLETDDGRAIPLLSVLLGKADADDRTRIVRRLAELPGDAARAAVLEGLNLALRDRLPEVAREAILALRKIGFPADAEPLLENAAQLTDAMVVAAAAESLGEVGSRAVLPLLRRLARGYLRERAVKQAAQRAIERIEARFGIAGGLSLVDAPGDGGLSLSDDANGGLSLAETAGSDKP